MSYVFPSPRALMLANPRGQGAGTVQNWFSKRAPAPAALEFARSTNPWLHPSRQNQKSGGRDRTLCYVFQKILTHTRLKALEEKDHTAASRPPAVNSSRSQEAATRQVSARWREGVCPPGACDPTGWSCSERGRQVGVLRAESVDTALTPPWGH